MGLYVVSRSAWIQRWFLRTFKILYILQKSCVWQSYIWQYFKLSLRCGENRISFMRIDILSLVDKEDITNVQGWNHGPLQQTYVFIANYDDIVSTGFLDINPILEIPKSLLGKEETGPSLAPGSIWLQNTQSRHSHSRVSSVMLAWFAASSTSASHENLE